MNIDVNGKPMRLPPEQSIADLITKLDLDGRLVVVELNRQIVRRTEREAIALKEGDRVEIVHFVGGG